MDMRFAERAGEEYVNERKIISAIIEAAVHGRTVAFLCPTQRNASDMKRKLVDKAKSLDGTYADPVIASQLEVRFKSGGSVHFVIRGPHKDGYDFDRVIMDEGLWI